jgi:hypothetical protein
MSNPSAYVFRIIDEPIKNEGPTDEELSIPETIEICKSFSSFGSETLGGDTVVTYHRFDLSSDYNQNKVFSSSSFSLQETTAVQNQKNKKITTSRQLALFSLEIGTCIIFIFGMAIMVVIMWCQFTEVTEEAT